MDEKTISSAENSTDTKIKPTLLLMRHGKSDRAAQADRDFDRTLSDKGHRDSPRIGQWIRTSQYVPDRIICSPATRATQTAQHVCREIGMSPTHIDSDARIYDADLDLLLAVLAEVSVTVERLMMVGHNPGFSNLLNYLCPENSTGRSMPTAALAIMTLDNPWTDLNENKGNLLSLILPTQLEH